MNSKCKKMLLTLMFISILSFSFATTLKLMETNDLIKKADAIVIGECTEKESVWVDGHVETTMTFKVSESLKGSSKEGDTINITQMGGKIPGKPIAQYVQGMPEFYKGEKSMLFLSMTPKQAKSLEPKSRGSKLGTTPAVIGLYQGKYNIVEDEKTGKLFAVRYNLGNINLIADDAAYQKMDKALKAKAQMIKEGTLKEENIAIDEKTAQEIKEKAKEGKQPEIKKKTSGKYPVVKADSIDKSNSLKDLGEFKKEINAIVKK